MSSDSISRRDILRTLAMGAVGGSVLQLIPLAAAEHVHRMVKQEKAETPAGEYKPKFFPPHQYATLRSLCDAIIPADEKSGGAIQAGAPEFIDLFGNPYLSCTTEQKTQVLDLIAYRKNALSDPSLSQGVEFFAFLRNLTTDGFYSSEIGIADLEYIGNTFVREFPGCPPVPEA
jgi:gluconate 2-dehydrogenase gamma chain